MEKNKTLIEWFGEPTETTPGIMKIVTQNLDQEIPANIPSEEPEEKNPDENVEDVNSLMKSIFLTSLIKNNLEELLKVSNISLTKEYKNDILEKIEKLKEEVNKF